MTAHELRARNSERIAGEVRRVPSDTIAALDRVRPWFYALVFGLAAGVVALWWVLR